MQRKIIIYCNTFCYGITMKLTNYKLNRNQLRKWNCQNCSLLILRKQFNSLEFLSNLKNMSLTISIFHYIVLPLVNLYHQKYVPLFFVTINHFSLLCKKIKQKINSWCAKEIPHKTWYDSTQNMVWFHTKHGMIPHKTWYFISSKYIGDARQMT